MGYSTTTSINNKIARKNSISKNTSVIAEYPDSVTDGVTVFLLHECQAMTSLSVITMYPVTLF